MLAEVLSWGLEPSWVTGDSWYSGVSNLKLIRHYQRGFLFALESNRLVSVEKGTGTQVQLTFRTPLTLDQRFFSHPCFEGAFEC
jgi:hypothetical protein